MHIKGEKKEKEKMNAEEKYACSRKMYDLLHDRANKEEWGSLACNKNEKTWNTSSGLFQKDNE